MTEEGARINLDRAFQNLFTLVNEVVAMYKQRDNIDGTAAPHRRLMEITPTMVDNHCRDYKACFDSTSPEVHVDCVLELYSKVRPSVLRGYMCNSWLTNQAPPVSLYHGLDADAAGSKVVHLDCVALMLDSLCRGNTQFREEADVLRFRFSCLVYGLFESCLRFSSVIGSETNVQSVTPVTPIQDDLVTLTRLKEEILADMPKPKSKASSSSGGPGANPFAAGLAGLLPANMNLNDLIKNFASRLPEIASTVTANVSKMTGVTISDQEQKVLDNALSNVSEIMSDPDKVSSLVGKFATGSGGINEIAEMLLRPPSSQTTVVPGLPPPTQD